MCRGELHWVGVRQELLAWIGMRIKDPRARLGAPEAVLFWKG